MTGFGFLYSSTKRYSTEKNIDYKTMSIDGKATGKMIAEFFAANGQDSIPTSLLRRTIILADKFLNKGFLDKKEAGKLVKEIDETVMPTIKEIMEPLLEKYDQDSEKLPFILFVFGYAQYILEGLVQISEITDYPTKHNRINLLRETIGKKRKNFPKPYRG